MPQPDAFLVRFWGVRGTVPVPDERTLHFGGNTSCVEVRCGGQLFILDAGTGIYPLGAQLKDAQADILLSHTHLDHLQGLPLFMPLYREGCALHVWAGHLQQRGGIRPVLERMMSAPLFPLALDQMKADVKLHDFAAGEALRTPRWEAAGVAVATFALTHPDGATGYRISHRGHSVCYITDHEHSDAATHAALAEFVRGADCLIYDATYDDASYPAHAGWGHSTWQVAVRLAEQAQVKQLMLFHHDPAAGDAQLLALQEEAARMRPGTLLAREGLQLNLRTGEMSQPQAVADSLKLVERLTDIGVALSAQRDVDHLLETILVEAQSMAHADGGTLYIRNAQDALDFAIMRNHTLGIAHGGSTGLKPPLPPLPLHVGKTPNYAALAAFAVLTGQPVAIDDVYSAEGFDFEGAKAFDMQHHYRTQSVLAIPMMNHKKEVLGCLQLVNARDAATGAVIPFSTRMQRLILSLASQAAIILDNKTLIQEQKDLLEAFIKMIAQAIDAKSPYTGAHCERVPTLTTMLANAACEAREGPFKLFSLSEEEKYELHIAGWMHDCGKVATPVHIMDKSTKLEKIFDRIALIEARFEVWQREARIGLLEGALTQQAYDAQIAQLDNDLAFLRKANIGGEFMADDALARLDAIAQRYRWQGGPGLTEDELHNLRVRRGTLTDEDRAIMNDHMVHTCAMLEALPFPKHLRRVPEYAGGHHERMDGKGYPKGIKAGGMSIPARMMAVADVFEALTAADRPYKPAKKLSEAMAIIGMMKTQHHLDPVVVDFFITSGVYRDYAKKYLAPELIDAVDEAALLAMQPPPL